VYVKIPSPAMKTEIRVDQAGREKHKADHHRNDELVIPRVRDFEEDERECSTYPIMYRKTGRAGAGRALP